MNRSLSTFLQSIFAAVAALAVYAFVSAVKDGEQQRLCAPICSLSPDYAGRNRLAPEFTLQDLDGKPVRLADYRGKVVILNFWTKTCRPCLEEMPALAELAKILENFPNIELVTVTTDESAEDARATLDSVLGVPPKFATLVDSSEAVVREMFGTRLYPETWFIDPNGIIRARIDGPRDWHGLAPLTIEFAESISGTLSCDVDFERRRPTGSMCNDFPIAG